MRHSPIRLGLLGCGSFAERRILPALAEVPTLQAVCLQKRDITQAQAVAAKFGLPRAVETRDELLRDPEVDAVFIMTPNHCHAEDAIACGKAGKPTLCEKPLAPTVAEIIRMMGTFERLNVPLLVAHSLRFKPCLAKAKEILHSGALGHLKRIHAHYLTNPPKDNWRHFKAFGGGVLQDIGVHLIDLIQDLSGQRIVSVHAKGHFLEVDETVSAECRLEGGADASFICSFEQTLPNGFEVIGTQGRLESLNSLRQTSEPIETLFFTREGGATEMVPLPWNNVYLEELKHFAEVLKKGIPSRIPASIGLQNQKVIEAVYRSINLGKEVEVV